MVVVPLGQVAGEPGTYRARLIDRASSEDLMSLAGDTGTVPMQVGGVLFLRTGPDWSPQHLVEELSARVPAVPRLRQRLRPVPLGLGRPVWQDLPDFSADDHIKVVTSGGGHQGALDLAADLLVERLPTDRPLWTMRVVTGFAPDEAAVVLVLHHVLADGVAALAILSTLAGPQAATPTGFPRPMPGGLALLGDNLRERARGLLATPARVIRLVAALAVLRIPRAAPVRTSLNRPTGTRRRVATVWCGLDEALAVSRFHGATVNDLTLAVIAEALGGVATARGEHLPDVVVSVPISARRTTAATQLGNQTGVMPLSVSAHGERVARLGAIAAMTRKAKTHPAGASAAVLGPLFRWLAQLGLFRWFTDHQRLVHTFATNLRGPAQRLRLGGLEVTGIIPLSVTTGNITAAFATFSYAGDLGITIIADPDEFPELENLRLALAAGLDGYLQTRSVPAAGPVGTAEHRR